MWKLEGTTLGRYQLQRRLARGGMSVIHLAYDTRMRRTVAIKIVPRSDKADIQRFQREVKALSRLKHAHILPILEYGEHDLYCYCAMPYIERGTLRQRLAQGPLSLAEAALIFTQTANALHYAHEHGILHRDIKPANILLRHERHIYLADFGLAKEIEAYSAITADGELVGTPEYMAPELIEEPASISSDIYSLGILLYHMLTGQVPFKASNPIATCRKHLLEQPVCPSLLNPTIPYAVEQIILQSLEKDPQRRFPSVQAMVQAFEQALPAPSLLQTLSTGYHKSVPRFAALSQRELGRILGTNLQWDVLSIVPPHLHSKASTRSIMLPGQQALSLPRAYSPHVHSAQVALIATLLFAFSLSLGFFTYLDGSHGQLSSALSTNTLMAKAANLPHEAPPHDLPVPDPFAASNASNNGCYGGQSGNVNYLSSHVTHSSGYEKENGDSDSHGKKDDRGHRHKHGHGD